MGSISGLLIMLLTSFLAADELRMEDFFTEVKPAFPPLAERETLPEDQVRELQSEWENAKQTRLLKDRRAIWLKIGTENKEYWSSYLKYNNQEIIDIVLEMTCVEYECYKKFETIQDSDNLDNMDFIECAQQKKALSDEDEFQMEYDYLFNGIAISTFSPEIFNIVFTSFLSSSHARDEYFLTIDAENHLEAILNGNLKGGALWYKYHDISTFRSLYSDELIVSMLIKYPELGWKYRDKVFALINATINSPEERVAWHARRLQRCMDIIIRMHQTTEGECVAEGEEE